MRQNQKLAPWVLRRAQESGKEIGVAWMSKLHTKLSSQFKPYRLLTIDIASLLLAKVKNSEAEQKRILERKKQVEDVLIRAQSATVILSDDEQWNALDDHQKAWVALSASQERTDNKIDDLTKYMLELTHYLQPDLRLTTFEDEPDSPNKDTFSILLFRRRKSRLIGRETELQELSDFYESDQGLFGWWVITGVPSQISE